MPRYAPDHKPRTRRMIVSAAARRFRRRGYAASGVDAVMGDAGLTAGGFYAHFSSKEELLAEVLGEGLAQTRDVLLAGIPDLPVRERLPEVVRRYLSRQHRDAPDAGCAIPALAAEVGRLDGPARRVLDRYVRAMADELGKHAPGGAGLASGDAVLGGLALSVGALMLSRAVEDRELSDRILVAGRRFAGAALGAGGKG